MKKLCAAAHKKLVGKGYYMIEWLAYKNGTLSFNCTKYLPMRVVFVEYTLRNRDIPEDLEPYNLIEENKHWYLTQGLHKGCVFYLDLVNSSIMEFNLHKHICGLKHKYI